MKMNYTKYQEFLPGLILTTIITILARFLAVWLPGPGSVTLAIIIGILVGNLFKPNTGFYKGINFSKDKLLSLAIVFMGLELQFGALSELGLSIFFIVIIMVSSSILIGYIIGKLSGLSTGFSILLGVGNGICGSSAIAATAPLLNSDEKEVGISISVVNFLGTLGIFLLPLLSHLLKLSITDSSIMIGGTLQAVGQVVAAGFSINEQVGNLATVVKMARILMLGPVILLINFLNSSKNTGGNKISSSSKFKLPPFIIGFFIFSIIGNLNLLPVAITNYLQYISKFLLTMAMAAIGIKIKISNLLNQGPRALSVGFLIFGGQILLIIFLLKLFF